MLFLKNKKNFTFIELAIVSLLVFIISLGIYNVFSSGLKIWSKVLDSANLEDINIAFEKFTSDLRNTFLFKNIDFKGTKTTLEIPANVNSKFGKTPGKVLYIYDENKKVLLREEKDFSKLYTDSDGLKRILLDNVEDIEFKYYYYDKEKLEYVWEDETKEELPFTVKLRIKINNKDICRFINIPISNG